MNKELPTYEEFCGGLLATIKRPDIVNGGNNGGNGDGNGGNNGGNGGKAQLAERQRRIYHLIAAIHDISVKQMAVILNMSERTLERELAVMQKNNIIRHEGKARTGHWVVLD